MMLRRSRIPARRSKPRRKGQPLPRVKPERVEDPKHLQRLREFGCWACRVDGMGWRYAEPHHPRPGQGMGMKSDDRDAIPVCPRHHNEQHPDSVSIHRNPHEFRARYGTEAEIRDQVNALIYIEQAS